MAPGNQPQERRSRRVPVPARKAGLVLAAVCVAMVVLELLLRALGFHSPVLYCSDADTGYDLRPDQDVRLLGNHIQINNLSLRDTRNISTRDRNPGPESNVFRIGVFGDSVTWGGVRIRQKDLFTTKLEELLAGSHTGVVFEVYNGGVNGYSVKQAVDKARNTHASAGFDLILIYLIERNFHRNPHVRVLHDALPFPQSKRASAVCQAVGRAIVIINQKSGEKLFLSPEATTITRELADEEILKANTDSLCAFQADMSRKGAPVVVFLSPRKSLLEEEETRFEALAQGLGDRLPLVRSLLDDFRQQGATAAEYYYDHVHLSVQGHEFVSRTILAYLKERGVIEQIVQGRSKRSE